MKGRKTRLIPMLKSVWAFAIWRAGPSAVAATACVRRRLGGAHVVEDQLEAEEEEPGPEHRLADVLHHPPPRQEGRREAEPDEERRVVREPEGDELHRQRRTDVGAEDHAERLPEAHETRGDETDQHERRRGRGLDDRRDPRAGDYREEAIPRAPHEEAPEAPLERALERLAAQADPLDPDPPAPAQA